MKRALLFIVLTLFIFRSNAQIAAIDVDKGSGKAAVEDIIIVFKMHFDIGYTDWAESVLQKYTTSMIDETMHSVQVTSQLPTEDQFVWTLPGWPMKYILENVSVDRKPAIEDALRKGRLRTHALPFTFETESSDLETLVRGMSYSSQINRAYGQPLVRGAKLTDVPSHSWILPTLLTQAGVKILHIGCNPGSVSPDIPTLFWWEGPDGSRLLTFNWAEYYGSGVLPPDGWKYKTWLAMIHTHENTGAPTPEDVAAVLAEARTKAPGAKVRIGQLEDFYDTLMKENPSLPVVRGDMPDTWIHGYMSMPRDVKTNKSMQRVIYNEETLNTLLRNWKAKAEPVSPYVNKAIEQSLLFDEHTFGLALSHGHQGGWKYGSSFVKDRARGAYDFAEESWYEKGNHSHRAKQYIIPSLRKDLKNLAGSVRLEGKKVVVYNPLPWQRSGIVAFYMDVYRKNFELKNLKDEVTGEIIPVNNEGNYLSFMASDIPSLGYKSYSIATEPVQEKANDLRIDRSAGVLENSSFRLTISSLNGSLLSVWDKKQQKEMVDKESGFGFGEYIHEKFGQEEIDRYNASYVKPGHHDWADQEMGRPADPALRYEQIKGKTAKIEYSQTAHAVSATAFCRTSRGEDYTLTYTLHEGSPYLEIIWGIQNKQADMQPEGGWLAFPFNVSQPVFRLGRTGAVVDPATDFVKNSNHDYYFLNTGMAVIDKKGDGFGLNTPNAPAVSLDRPGLYHFSGDFIPQRPNVFVNLFNTQWGTNFAEWVEGSLSAKVYLWSVDAYKNESSLITPTEETRVPLMGVYMEGKGGKLPLSAEGIQLSRKGVLVTAFGENTDGEGDLLRVWEQAGDTGECVVTLPEDSGYRTACYCNLRGEPQGNPFPLKNNKISLKMKAYQPVSLLLEK